MLDWIGQIMRIFFWGLFGQDKLPLSNLQSTWIGVNHTSNVVQSNLVHILNIQFES